MSSSELNRIRHEYGKEIRSRDRSINHAWHPLNPVAICFRQSRERIVSKILRKMQPDFNSSMCLDIGCGYGEFLRFLISSGYKSRNVHGIDLILERALRAKSTVPIGTPIISSDASHIPYRNQSFDLVSQFTVISSIFDLEMRSIICEEMQRVLVPGGFILWYDMYRTRSESTVAIQSSQIEILFPDCRIIELYRIHSFFTSKIAKFSHTLCNIIDILPGLPKTHLLILLRKNYPGDILN